MSIIVNIKNYQRKFQIDRKKIKRVIEEIFKILDVVDSEISIIYVTPKKISFFSESFRKSLGPTDVLSFPDGERGENGLIYLGDIIISPHIVKENSEMYNNGNFNNEFLLVHVHAILHLLGYTHGSNEEMEKMFLLQDKIVEKIKNMEMI